MFFKVAATRTFQFTLNYFPSTATNVYYLIDFGDKSPIYLPAFASSQTTQVSYAYARSGLFTVNITMFNKVSAFSQSVQVKNFKKF